MKVSERFCIAAKGLISNVATKTLAVDTVTLVTPAHPAKAVESIVNLPPHVIVIDLRPVHPLKAFCPIVRSLVVVMATLVTPAHPAKAVESIVNLPPHVIVMDVRPVHPLKAFCPNVRSLVVLMVKDVMEVQSAYALLDMTRGAVSDSESDGNDRQPLKAPAPMDWIVLSIRWVAKAVQPLKQLATILVGCGPIKLTFVNVAAAGLNI